MIQHGVELGGFNTFGLPCEAEHFCMIKGQAELIHALQICDREGWKPRLIGGGSNLILPPEISGCVLLMRNRGIEVQDAGSEVLITVAAGENWHDLVRFCLAHGYHGIENLACIPGSAGAAPMQNIGAYGVELESLFYSLEAVSLSDGLVHTFSAEDCGFSYRHSFFKSTLKDRYAILRLSLKLSRSYQPVLDYPDVRLELTDRGITQPDARSVYQAIVRIRQRKLPALDRYGNVGSFFKNPVVDEAKAGQLKSMLPGLQVFETGAGFKLSAAALIDACGCKDRRCGGAAVWNRQPLVLINTGTASYADLAGLARAIRQAVAERCNILLELEPHLPDPSSWNKLTATE